jgi:hypothetical protein
MASNPNPNPDPKYKYTIHRIPNQFSTSPTVLKQLIQKFKQTKLIALEAEPDAFAVKHADEVLHSPEVWNQRVAGLSTVLICVASPVDAATSDSTSISTTPTQANSNSTSVAKYTNRDTEALLNPTGHWIGMATIRGPLPWSTYHLPLSGQPIPDDPEAETKWHLCNVCMEISTTKCFLA